MKKIILLQLVVMIYTFSNIVAKFASGKELFSPAFILLYGLEVVILGIYAILWQQMIKKFPLSVAYANRAMALLWSGIWAVFIFEEVLTWKQLLGMFLVVIGTLFVNKDTPLQEGKEAGREDA